MKQRIYIDTSVFGDTLTALTGTSTHVNALTGRMRKKCQGKIAAAAQTIPMESTGTNLTKGQLAEK